MKACIPLFFSFVFMSLSAQNSTFNMGWTTKAERIICADGNTMIVTGDVSPDHLTLKYLAKFMKTGQTYSEVARLYISDTILDYRFHNGNLNLITHDRFECDFGPNDTNFIQIDTATMSEVRRFNLINSFRFGHVSFSTDTSLWFMGQAFYPSYLVNFDMEIIDSIETPLVVPEHVNSSPDGKLIFIGSQWEPAVIDLTRYQSSWHLDSTYVPYTIYSTFPPIPSIRDSYFFGQDSILMLTDNAIHKTDTSLINIKSKPVDSYNNFIFSDSTYTLVHDKAALHYRISDHSLLRIDSLTGLPGRFELQDIWTGGNDTLIIARSLGEAALRELHVQSGLQLSPPADAYSLTLDSIVLNNAAPYANGLYNRQASFSLHISNTGTAPISNFKLLFKDHPRYGHCTSTRERDINMNLNPGQSVKITQSIRYWNWTEACFYMSTPDEKLEMDISDNYNCMTVSLSNDEFEIEPAIQVFPNPTSGYLNIQLGIPSDGEIEVYDLSGKICATKSFSKVDNLEMDFADLKSGIYLLKIKLDNDSVILKRVAVSNN